MAAYIYDATVERWVDADTVDLIVDLGFRMSFRDRFRLYGIDAWEVRGEEREKGLAATVAAVQMAPVGSQVIVETYPEERGKFGRWLCSIWAAHERPDLASINERLVEAGHAKFVKY
jgi:micrococcal nuclease